MCQYLDVVPPGRDENRRHTRGYVEDFRPATSGNAQEIGADRVKNSSI